MNLEDITESLSRLDKNYIDYVDQIVTLNDIDLSRELPSAFIIYLKSREYYLKNNLNKAKLYYRLNHILHSSSIPFEASIGKNSVFAYGGIGTIIHNASQLGSRCTIGSNVTIGGAQTGVPIIGDDVYISTGAKIIGGVRIGTGAIIGANAVVRNDIEPFSVAAGIPAKIVSRVTASSFNKYSGFYWCKNSIESSQKFCEWHIKQGLLSEN